ncbi:MAG: hypothetical protein A3A58_03150 [Candidatus Blackburnbacteria bacterium RIFCSPLOWO2_01_FULL_41_27]|uniref:Uncharacterized protein n=2 Tax=Candidatus Blackburniibacteriota TaxID=1817898 RepID=A0A1G1V509_9BACT|nr:MAG: hypothetical protein A3F61_03985 [Candidatus Blackburnbacteria bacterium RIFCSPHIGHO2_12_FULL_41_13b]OGY14525.1 MAG: hypothetical protein A3A58_03150 [Candidatus Blackburnbacteria bacterium RIFCSPLOWO2_01_FULL_41_27]
MGNQNIRYQNLTLKPLSYQLLVSRKWIPKLMLGEDMLNSVKETPLTWRKEFATERDANAYATAQAKMFIDKKSGS